MLDLAPHTETLLTVIVAAIPNIIMALAAYRKVGRQERKLDSIQKQTNGNQAEMQKRTDYLSSRLSQYERLPSTFKEIKHEGNPESGGSGSGGSDAGGPSGEQRGNEEPV